VTATTRVIVSGRTAAGKTTHAYLLAAEFGLRYVSASQLLLRRRGEHAVQAPDYWITDAGQATSRSPATGWVDGELRRLLAEPVDSVFDCVSLAWHKGAGTLAIWLESSLDSRIAKAASSQRRDRRGQPMPPDHLRAALTRKDAAAGDLLRDSAGADLAGDPRVFDLVVDVSGSTRTESRAAARVGIREVHGLLAAACAAWCSAGGRELAEWERACAEAAPSVMVARAPDWIRAPGR
jgi:CMP/dCMP kinase